MFQLIHGDDLLALHGFEDSLNLHIVAVADEGGILLLLIQFLPVQRFGIVLLQDETGDVHHCFTADIQGFHAGHVRLVRALRDLLDDAFADLLAVVVHQENLGVLLRIVLERQEEPVLRDVVAEESQAGTVVDALHTADALVVIDLRHVVGGDFGDGALRAGERTGVAGETVEAVGHDEWLLQTVAAGTVGFFKHAHRMLLGISVILGHSEVIVVVEAHVQGLGDFHGGLFAAQYGAGALTHAGGVTDAVGVESEGDLALFKDEVVGFQTGTYINKVDVFDDLLGAGHGLEVLAFGNHCANHAGVILVGDGLKQRMGGDDGDAETAHAVGLHRESTFVIHGLDDGHHFRTCLNGLIRREVADIAGTDGEDALAEERVLQVHHLLHDSGGIDARQIVVLEGGHERERTRGHDEEVGIHEEDAAVFHILGGHALAFEDVPHGAVEQDAGVVVAGERLGDVETAHAAVLLLLLEEEELVGLHRELSADAVVVVDDDVGDAELVELFAAGEAGGTRADDGDFGLIDFRGGGGFVGSGFGKIVVGNLLHLLHAIDEGDADAFHHAIDEHFAGAALADAAVHTALTALQTVTVDGEPRLVQGRCDGVALRGFHLLTLVLKGRDLPFGNIQNGMV